VTVLSSKTHEAAGVAHFDHRAGRENTGFPEQRNRLHYLFTHG
jgi:hypothetical protein